MPGPEQGLPINPLQKAFTTLILGTPTLANALAGDKIFDQLVPPTVDTTTTRPLPYMCWANVTDAPNGDFSGEFGKAGSASTLALHIFDAHLFTKSFVLDLVDKVKRLISGKKHTLEGFETRTCIVNTIGVFQTAVGQQAILSIDVTTSTIPS
jgi:hypothetical protein